MTNQPLEINKGVIKHVSVYSDGIYKVHVSVNRYFMVRHDPCLDSFLNKNVQLDLFTPESKTKSDEGEAKKNEGINKAIKNAQKADPGWLEKAKKEFIRFISNQPEGKTFTAEDVRMFTEQNNTLPQPPNTKSWGGVTLSISRMGLIQSVGFVPSKNPAAHKRYTRLYMKK